MAPRNTALDASSRNPALLISEEAQDLILSHFQDRQGLQIYSKQQTYSHFCLVTRQWLSAGRRALYRAPSLPYRESLWTKAEALLRTITNNTLLGGYVRDVREIYSVTSSLAYGQHSRWTTRDGGALTATYGTSDPYGITQEWFLRLLKACRHLHAVSYELQDPAIASALAAATPSTVRTATIEPTNPEAFSPWSKDFKFALDVLRVNLGDLDSAASFEQTGLTFTVKALEINGVLNRISNILPFLPQDTRILTSLVLDYIIPSFSKSDVAQLVAIVGPQLERLRCSLYDPDYIVMQAERLDNYMNTAEDTILPTLLAALPSLRRLQLFAFRSLTLDELSLLAQNSPLIQHIDLTTSLWYFDVPGHELSTTFIRAIPRLEAMLADRKTFPVLNTLNLGQLPIESNETRNAPEFRPLREACEERGIKLLYQCCWPVCESCGEIDVVCGCKICEECGEQEEECMCDEERYDGSCDECGKSGEACACIEFEFINRDGDFEDDEW